LADKSARSAELLVLMDELRQTNLQTAFGSGVAACPSVSHLERVARHVTNLGELVMMMWMRLCLWDVLWKLVCVIACRSVVA
jgi:hypothetical protein